MSRRTRHTCWSLQPQAVCRRVIGQHDRVGARQRRKRLAQPADGQQRILRVAGRDQHDVEVARQSPMLEAIVQQVQLRTESLLGQSPGGVAVFADDDRHSQLARDQQRLVAKFARRAARIDQRHARGLAPVAAREHIERNAALLQQLAQQNEERRLARAADREIADAHHRALQAAERSACRGRRVRLRALTAAPYSAESGFTRAAPR